MLWEITTSAAPHRYKASEVLMKDKGLAVVEQTANKVLVRHKEKAEPKGRPSRKGNIKKKPSCMVGGKKLYMEL